MFSESTGGTQRYRLLDAWRGIAALGVLAFHTTANLVDPDSSWAAAALSHGWLGVFIFFPVSGYCILAASHAAANHTTAAFLRRRWRRIFPAYWASVVLAIVLLLAAAPFGTGSVRATLAEPGLKWFAILTLTQTFVGADTAINPVYWSLCFEEQFYVVIAATMLCAPRRRPALLAAVTVVAAIVQCLGPLVHVPPGLFLDRWISFAVGLAVFGWHDVRYGRWWARSIFALAGIVEVLTWRFDVAVSTIVALILLGLRKHDHALSSLRPVAALAGAGAISYSLYLTHFPIVSRIVTAALRVTDRPATWWIPITIMASGAALAVAARFSQVVERRFQGAGSPMPRGSWSDVDVALA